MTVELIFVDSTFRQNCLSCIRLSSDKRNKSLPQFPLQWRGTLSVH